MPDSCVGLPVRTLWEEAACCPACQSSAASESTRSSRARRGRAAACMLPRHSEAAALNRPCTPVLVDGDATVQSTCSVILQHIGGQHGTSTHWSTIGQRFGQPSVDHSVNRRRSHVPATPSGRTRECVSRHGTRSGTRSCLPASKTTLKSTWMISPVLRCNRMLSRCRSPRPSTYPTCQLVWQLKHTVKQPHRLPTMHPAAKLDA